MFDLFVRSRRTETIQPTVPPPVVDYHHPHYISVAKGISWRIVGTIDTFILSYLISGHAVIAAKISGAEVFTKVILYYFHERAWLRGLRWRRKMRRLPSISNSRELQVDQMTQTS